MSRATRVLLRGFLLGLFAMVPMFGCGMPTSQEPAASEQTATATSGQKSAAKPLKSGVGVEVDTPIGGGGANVGDGPGVGVDVQTPVPAEGSVEVTFSNEEPAAHIEQAGYYRRSGVTVYYGPRYGYYRPYYYYPYRPYYYHNYGYYPYQNYYMYYNYNSGW